MKHLVIISNIDGNGDPKTASKPFNMNFERRTVSVSEVGKKVIAFEKNKWGIKKMKWDWECEKVPAGGCYAIIDVDPQDERFEAISDYHVSYKEIVGGE